MYDGKTGWVYLREKARTAPSEPLEYVPAYGRNGYPTLYRQIQPTVNTSKQRIMEAAEVNCPTCNRPMPKPAGLLFPKPERTKGRGCRVSYRDEEAKRRLGYTNPLSFVRRDGSEVLRGEDWARRMRELGERSGGKCEVQRCIYRAVDAHHIVMRSRKRDDRLANLLDVCRSCHRSLDGRRIGGRRK